MDDEQNANTEEERRDDDAPTVRLLDAAARTTTLRHIIVMIMSDKKCCERYLLDPKEELHQLRNWRYGNQITNYCAIGEVKHHQLRNRIQTQQIGNIWYTLTRYAPESGYFGSKCDVNYLPSTKCPNNRPCDLLAMHGLVTLALSSLTH
eukprot:scaffold18522_cov70-Skeletonema_menzelii.AAC.1